LPITRVSAADRLFSLLVAQLAGQHQAPGGGVDEQRGRAPHVRAPVAAADLVADQRIARGLVGDAQQRLGQAHQRHALLAGSENSCTSAATPLATGASRRPCTRRAASVHGIGLRRVSARQRQQRGQALGLGPVPGGGDGGAQLGLRQDGLGERQERLHLVGGIRLHLLHALVPGRRRIQRDADAGSPRSSASTYCGTACLSSQWGVRPSRCAAARMRSRSASSTLMPMVVDM
jgi:hypothetical protein